MLQTTTIARADGQRFTSGFAFNFQEGKIILKLIQIFMFQVKSDYLKEQQEGDQQMNTFHPPIGNSQF